MPTKGNHTAEAADARLASGEAWRSFCRSLESVAERVLGEGVPATPRDRAEGFRHLLRFLSAGQVQCVTHADPDYPLFARMIEYAAPWGLDNPDCLYLYAAVRGDATYRISGNRGSAHHLDLQVNYGHFSSGDIGSWGTIASIDGTQLDAAPDGRFELLLGPEVAPDKGLRIEPNAEFVLVRQYFNDWENERPADLLIERLGEIGPIPPPRPEQIVAQLERLGRWLEKGGALWDRMSRGLLGMEPNSLVVHLPQDADKRAGLRGQAYGMGNFRCGPEEAVLVELTPPACHHWSVSLANRYWESIEFASRQSSLNGHQAQLDSEGVFRAVISHTDPGVPNWLDTAGHSQGTIAARFLLAESAPLPKLTPLPVRSVLAALPPDTPRISPEERARSLERRRRAVWRRYRA